LRGAPACVEPVELVEAGEAAGIIGVRLNRLARSPEVYGEVKRRVLAAGGVVVAASVQTNPRWTCRRTAARASPVTRWHEHGRCSGWLELGR
jgi:hypothetical protein